MMTQELASFHAAILRQFPDLKGLPYRRLAEGWHSIAIEVAARLVFKFPKNKIAEQALIKEAALLAKVRPHLALPVPAMSIHEGPPIFSCHEKLQGEPLLAECYHSLSDRARHRLAHDLAGFYADLHRLDLDEMRGSGAGAIEEWQSVDAIRKKAVPALPAEFHPQAEEWISAFECLPPDPCGQTYGFFDGHGWNMAFDFDQQRLNGIYDFADSGIGPLHQEFIYSNFISRDLTERVIDAYEERTGRSLDRRRIAILTAIHRLSELAELADDPCHAPTMVRHVVEWLSLPVELRAQSR